jgi:hypothetical protein
MIFLGQRFGNRLGGRLGDRLGRPYGWRCWRRIVPSVLAHGREGGDCSGDD